MATGPVARRDFGVVPALAVDRVHADQLEPSGVDLVGQRSRYAAVLVLEEPPHRGREEEDRTAPVAEPEVFHRPAQCWAVPGAVFALHADASLLTRPRGDRRELPSFDCRSRRGPIGFPWPDGALQEAS